LPTNTAVRFTTTNGRSDLVLSPLDRREEPASRIALRARTSAMRPHGDLPDVLREVHRRTGFLHAFTHLSERTAHLNDLPTSRCAVLIAAACTIGFAPLVANTPALTRDRLTSVQHHYVRSETLAHANARRVDAHRHNPVAQRWGTGEVASADGLRFVVPVRTIHAASNPKYFGPARGVTCDNLVADQGIGLPGMVVTGTLRDSLVVLRLLLGQQTPLQPTEIMTDTGAYADHMVGILWLLGSPFSPRIRAVGGTRLWRIDRTADYGALNDRARHPIRTDRIRDHWDDLLRLAGSLTTGTVPAESLIRTLQRGDRPTKLGRALQELGRIMKTRFVLNYLDDATYRRRILTQLNRGEGRHTLARVVFYGHRGELRQRYREGQEDQLTAVGLVVNAIIVWNTLYLERAIDATRAAGHPVDDADIARLSPLVHAHLNVLGRSSFTLPADLERGAWRPLRTPEGA
jgi:TnpA family transposase